LVQTSPKVLFTLLTYTELNSTIRPTHKRMPEMTIETRDQSPEAILQRIDAIMRELGELRQMALRIQSQPTTGDLAQQLYGVLGHGSWEEYDMQLDCQQ
jgi:hypothetical protein